MIKVILVDDHELVSRGIEALLNAEQDITVTHVFNCGEAALQMLYQDPPDVILMDIYMPGIGGLEACRRVLKTLPEVKVLGLSVDTDLALSNQLLKLGFKGFVSKASPTEEMVEAIRTVAAGNLYLSKCVVAATDSPFSKLSKRELDVARLILQGKSIQEIASMLELNAKTVNTYRYRMYEKLHVKNDVELMRLASGLNHLNGL